jgi:Flp pilus assembly protein TadB
MTNEEMAVKITEVDARTKSNSYRLDDVEKRQADSEKMLNSIALIAQRQDTMDNDIKEIKTDVKTLTGQPGKRWESIVDKIILTVVAAFAAYVLVRVGLG